MFQLMLKDEIIAYFIIEYGQYDMTIKFHEILNSSLIPLGIQSKYYTLQTWLESRYILVYKKETKEFFSTLGINNISEFIDITHCTSLNDCHWVKSEHSKVSWASVSLFRNSFNSNISNYSFTGKILNKNVGSSPDFSTDGTFPKCWVRKGGIYLIKGGTTFASNSGYEPFSEIFACQLAEFLDIPIIHQDYLQYKGVDASKCKCICTEDIGIVKLNELYNKQITDFKWLLGKFKNDIKIQKILILDYLLCNVDRHFGNVWLYFDTSNNKVLGFTESCDNNLSCIPYYTTDQDLYYYINDIRAKDGKTWHDLLSLLDKKLVSYYFEKARKFKFKPIGVEKADRRVIILNDMLKYQISNRITH